MISSYRLGDLVILSLNNVEQQELIAEHPNTIGSQYIVEKIHGKSTIDRIELVKNIVLDSIQKHEDLLPKDIENSTVVHLRLGDVVGGNAFHEKGKRPLNVDYLEKMVNVTDKVYVIGKCFYAKPSSTNYDECNELSNKYLQDVLQRLNAEHFDGGHADIDLCCAVKAKQFVQGKGYFSKLIVEIRKKLNLQSIETKVEG